MGIRRNDYIGFWKKSIKLSEENLKMALLEEAVLHKRANYQDAQIEKINFRNENKNDVCTIEMRIVCVEDIAREKPVFTDEN